MKIKENGKKDKYLDPAKKLKMLGNIKITVIQIITGSFVMVPKGFKGTERAENIRTCRYQADFSITKISQNTEKSHGGMRRLAITQTPAKDHQLTLV